MTTNNQLTSAPIAKIKGQDCRYTKIDNKKFLYYSDLTKIVGKDFVRELRTPPIVARVSDGSNSQDRRLVNVTDFRNALRQLAETKGATKKAVKTTKMPSACTNSDQACFEFIQPKEKKVVAQACPEVVKVKLTSTEAEGFDLSDIKLDTSLVGSIYSKLRAKDETLKSQINAIVHKYVNNLVMENGFSDDSPEVCELRAHAYTSLYKEFDAHYSTELDKRGMTMSQVGLGAKVRYNGNRYMDVLASKGALESLFAVAKRFFNKK